MIKVPRGQQTTIKNVIYPNAKKTDNTFHKQNILSIKNKQVENKMKKEAQDRYIPRKKIYRLLYS